jgi:hypothetical protein
MRLAALHSSFRLICQSIPQLVGASEAFLLRLRGMQPVQLLFSALNCLGRTHECALRIFSLTPLAWEGSFMASCAQLFRLSVVQHQMQRSVHAVVLRSSYVCEVKEWDMPGRVSLLAAEGCEWQSNNNVRVVLCTDALLVITPSGTAAKGSALGSMFFGGSLPLVAKKGNQLIECVQLDGLRVKRDQSNPRMLLLEPRDSSGAAKYRFLPSADSQDDWFDALERAIASRATSNIGVDLRRVLMQEDSNIPIAVASLTDAISSLVKRGGFTDLWCQQPPFAELMANGPELVLTQMWKERVLPSSHPCMLLHALHYYLTMLPNGLLVSVEAVRKLASMHTNIAAEAVERVVSALPSCSQILLGHMMDFALKVGEVVGSH